ncbi:MAG: hypothetical protein U0T81_01830 [Saprospiraceae bacterium]
MEEKRLLSAENYELEAIMCNKAANAGTFATFQLEWTRQCQRCYEGQASDWHHNRDLSILVNEPNAFNNKEDLKRLVK